MEDNGSWCTIFAICGSSIDSVVIEERLGMKPDVFIRSGEISVPTIEQGSSRRFDERWSLDRCSYSLSGSQYKRTLSEQLHYWHNKLKALDKGLNYLTYNLDYWAVIDCQGYRKKDSDIPCLQYRINSKIITQLSDLNVDLDFVVS